MSKTSYVKKDGLARFLGHLVDKGLRVLAPTERPATAKPSIVFSEWKKGEPFSLLKATVSPKDTVLPECEPLFFFKQTRSPKDLNEKEISLSEKPEVQGTVVFACRPCDARGFEALDNPYLKGLFPDPYYKAKRDNLIVITLTCSTGCETCFCHWVGIGPTSPAGSDILMTAIEDGFVLQAITEKGKAILEESGLEDGTEKFPQALAARKACWETVSPAPDLHNAPESLKAMFSDEKFWTRWTDRCISCGACTYFCPTCYCFNITDEGEPGAPSGGRRLRSWDNCMSSRYTREASAHNPRSKKYERMRNRISHKFWTYPENWGSFLCSGCGRCITNCPVHLDIRAITLAAIEEHEKKGAK